MQFSNLQTLLILRVYTARYMKYAIPASHLLHSKQCTHTSTLVKMIPNTFALYQHTSHTHTVYHTCIHFVCGIRRPSFRMRKPRTRQWSRDPAVALDPRFGSNGLLCAARTIIAGTQFSSNSRVRFCLYIRGS